MAAVDALRAEFGTKIAPLQVAIGKADSFKGYVDVVHGRAWIHENGARHEVPVPDDLVDEVALRRDQLLEAAAEADDEVLSKYLEGEAISDAELEACLHKGVRDSVLAPVMLTSASRDIGRIVEVNLRNSSILCRGVCTVASGSPSSQMIKSGRCPPSARSPSTDSPSPRPASVAPDEVT